MTRLRCHIAGIPHRQPASLPSVGDIVSLVPEPTNNFDPNAIKVLWGDIHLGYVPKVDTATVRAFAFERMRVVEVEPQRKWSEVIIEDFVPAAESPVTPLAPQPEPHTTEGDAQ